MSWIEAQERGREIVHSALRTATEIAEVLEIPSATEVWKAGGDAGHDGYVALKSGFHFFFLVLRPVALGLGWFLFVAGKFIWENIVCDILYKHGLSQTKEALVATWKFQKSLTRKQMIIEAVIMALMTALYFLRRWLQRNRYIQRARAAINQQTHKVARVSFDHTSLLSKHDSFKGLERLSKSIIVLPIVAGATTRAPWSFGCSSSLKFLNGF